MRTTLAAMAVLLTLGGCGGSEESGPSTEAPTSTIAPETTTTLAPTTTAAATTTTQAVEPSRETLLAWERCSGELTLGFAFTDAITDPYALEAAVEHCTETGDQLAVDIRGLARTHPMVEAYSALLALNVSVSFANLASLTGDLTAADADRYAGEALEHIDVIDAGLG